MTLKSRLKGVAIGAFVGGAGQKVRAAAAEAKRVVRRQPRRVDFYHDVTDPWSHLLAQAVERMIGRYPVEWAFHLIAPPASDVDAQPKQRQAHGTNDARELAAHFDLDFPGKKHDLEIQHARWANSVLVRDRPFADQVRAAIEVGDAAWRGDLVTLQKTVGKWGHESLGAVAPVISAEYARLREAGHYQGGMLAYGGDWYWGIDRLGYLEQRLAADLDLEPGPPVVTRRGDDARPPERLAPGDGPLTLDYWFSFRSPYSYLSLPRLAELIAAYPTMTVKLRPVLPMVERGIPAPAIKRMYIVHDAKREADRLGIPFGRLADPLGKGVEHCMAIAHHAIGRGLGLAFLQSAAKGIWAEARDVADYLDLRFVVERAGLDWDDARAALADPAWKEWAETNAADLGTIGLWGVPSFRVGEYQTWGQDRVDFVADRLRRHHAAPPRVEVQEENG